MPYSIDFENDPPLLRLTLTGFWDQETLESFARDLERLVPAFRSAHPRYDTLTDATGFRVQAGDIVAGFERIKQLGSATKAGRSAIVVNGVLAGLQAKRAVVDATTQVFESTADALAWFESQPAL